MLAYTQLFLSHFLSQFGDRLWQFAVPIIFVIIWNDTLLPPAVFNFLLYSFKIIMLPVVGRWVDSTNRLNLIARGTFGQTTCIVCSSSLLLLLAYRVLQDRDLADSPLDVVLFGVLILVGIAGDLLSAASTLGIEKDWIVIIAAGDEELLTYLNTRLRRIDLACKFLAPFFFGVAVSLPSSRWSQVVVGTSFVSIWCLLASFPIFWSWRAAYLSFEELKRPKAAKVRQNPLAEMVRGGRKYLQQSSFGASLGYSFLYFTVLSDHHPLTTAYLKMDGVTPWMLGAARGFGAVTGIMGTYLFPRLRQWTGVATTSVISVWAFVFVVAPISVLFINTDEFWPLRSYVMLLAILFSRLFLWSVDLANQMIMQETVSEESRGEVNAMQGATCQVMELMMTILSLFFSSMWTFRFLVFASVGGVSLAALTITSWASRQVKGLKEPLTH